MCNKCNKNHLKAASFNRSFLYFSQLPLRCSFSLASCSFSFISSSLSFWINFNSNFDLSNSSELASGPEIEENLPLKWNSGLGNYFFYFYFYFLHSTAYLVTGKQTDNMFQIRLEIIRVYCVHGLHFRNVYYFWFNHVIIRNRFKRWYMI